MLLPPEFQFRLLVFASFLFYCGGAFVVIWPLNRCLRRHSSNHLLGLRAHVVHLVLRRVPLQLCSVSILFVGTGGFDNKYLGAPNTNGVFGMTLPTSSKELAAWDEEPSTWVGPWREVHWM